MRKVVLRQANARQLNGGVIISTHANRLERTSPRREGQNAVAAEKERHLYIVGHTLQANNHTPNQVPKASSEEVSFGHHNHSPYSACKACIFIHPCFAVEIQFALISNVERCRQEVMVKLWVENGSRINDVHVP